MITDRVTHVFIQPDTKNLVVSTDAATAPASVSLRLILRRFWLKLHLYLGLLGGGLFVLMSLTGSCLVFYKTIDEWLNPALLTTHGEGPYQTLSEVVAAARSASPPGGWLDGVSVPTHDRGVFQAWYKAPTTDRPGDRRWLQVTVDPYSGTILSRDREWGAYLVSWIYLLHSSLMLEKLGRTIVGYSALCLLVSIGTGLYLWWPRPGRLRHALTVQSGGTRIRRHYNWHKLSGLYGAVILGGLAFTGVYLAFGDYVVPIVRFFSPVQELPDGNTVQSIPVIGVRPLSIEQIVASAQQALPKGELRYVGLPFKDTDVYQVTFRQPSEADESNGQSQVWLDQYSGKVLYVHDSTQFTRGETFLAWLFPLHNGEAFGLIGKWMVFISGFVPLVLYVTALRMWWLKRQAHRRQRQPSFS